MSFYAARAEELAAHYNAVRPAFLSRVADAAPARGRLLDLGCGSGRDLAAFMEEGFDVWGVEPVREFREAAQRQFPQLAGRILEGALPDALPRGLGVFDVVHCSAVLMHLSREELFNAIFTIRDLLHPGGLAHLTFCLERPGLDADNRAADGRLFNPIQADQFRAILRRAGFAVVDEQEAADSLQRPEIRWQSLIVRREDGTSERPLLRIERIVNHDSKDATYKLALLRALAELASSHFHEARWLGGGRVGVPADLVVDCWIRYYWPLFESAVFIPQKNGEQPGCAKPVMFRQALTGLVEQFRAAGSYAAFIEAAEADPGIAVATRRKVREAIQKGPVVFASGNTFNWLRQDGRAYIEMAGDFWEQLAELSHWIEPAIRLRWAEETQRFSKDNLQTGDILNLLSADYEQQRNVALSRSLFSERQGLHCTWTNQPLRAFEIDHIIPYSLWHNNDLWNLVPAHRLVNNAKRDKLVARDCLFRQRDAVVHAWETHRNHAPKRFDRELARLLGAPIQPANWQSPAFNRLAEAIEATALRRQAERWSA